LVDAAIVAIIVNFAAGDVAGLYRWSPLRWTAAVQSVQTGGGSIGLFQSSNPNEPGKLDTGFLEVVDPDALRRIRKEQRETAIREAAASLASVERAFESQKRAVDDRIGVPLSLSASTPLFDELLLTKDSAAEAWSSLLSIAGRLTTRIETTRETLGRARGSSESPTLDELQQLAADATGWTEDADRMATYIEHLAVMITNLRTERLLQQDRSGG
jgi:hypothetical protein